MSERTPEFVAHLYLAEALANVTSPTNNQVEQAKVLLASHPRVATAFFSSVGSLDWLRALHMAGGLEPKPFYRARNGELRAPYWQAAMFLQRMAADEPSVVKDILLSIQTTNWVAIRQTFTILQALDDFSGEALGEHFANLVVGALETDHRLLLELSQTAHELHLDGKERAAAAMVHATLMRLAYTDFTFSEGGYVLYSEILAPILAQSETGLNALVDALEIALSHRYGTPDHDNVRYWRRSIEPHRINLSERSIIDLLIDLNRDALLKTDDTQLRLEGSMALLQSNWPTKRRIGIAHCYQYREDLQANEELIITLENLNNPHLFHELAKLVTEHTHNLSDVSGEVLKTFAQSLHESEDEDQRLEYNLWAAILPPNWLPEPPDDLVNEDELERLLFRDFYVSRYRRATAPLDKASFAEKVETLNDDELLALVRDPASAGVRVDWMNVSSAMWDLLAEYAKERGALDLLLKLGWEDLGENHSWNAIEAMQIIAGDNVRHWDEVFNWADRMITQGGAETLWPLGQLVESSSKDAPIELSGRVSALSIRVIEATRVSTAMEMGMGDSSILMRFLNLPSGKAVQALYELLRREITELRTIEGSDVGVPEWFTHTMLEPIAENPEVLGIDAWTGLGYYYALLLDNDPNSVDFVISRIRPNTAELSITSAAFWSGYLWTSVVSSDALQKLREVYRSTAPIIQYSAAIEEDIKARFFQHLVIGVLREVPGYDDLLMSTLDAVFTPESRGSIASALGYAMQDVADEPAADFRARVNFWFVNYWSTQVNRLGGRDGPQLAKYLRWLRYLRRPPSELSEAIEVSLTQVENNFDVEDVFNYLHSYIDEEPVIVLNLVAQCVEWYRLHGDFWLDNEQVKGLLYTTRPLALEQAVFSEVVAGFAELGAISLHDVRQLLAT